MSDNNSFENEESIVDYLRNQYLESDNKKELDYWDAYSKIILESIVLRDSMNLSQSDLAEKMETKQSVISRFENMGRLPNYDFMARLSSALGHKLGITLNGDFMAVVPERYQEMVRDKAKREKLLTEEIVEKLLINKLDDERLKENRMIYIDTSFDYDFEKLFKNDNDKINDTPVNLYIDQYSNASGF